MIEGMNYKIINKNAFAKGEFGKREKYLKADEKLLMFIDYKPDEKSKSPYLMDTLIKTYGVLPMKHIWDKWGDLIYTPVFVIKYSPENEESIIGYINNLPTKLGVIFGKEVRELYEKNVLRQQIVFLDYDEQEKLFEAWGVKDNMEDYLPLIDEWSKGYVYEKYGVTT